MLSGTLLYGSEPLCVLANAEDNFLAAFTGVRYLLSKSGDLDSSKYELMQQFGGIYLYRNVQEAATARFYVNTISEDSLK